MAINGERAYKLCLEAVGSSEGSGDWLEIDQARIDAFADVTEDHQFIHVDPEACRTLSPWGVPVAHGFLTLSLLTKLSASVPTPAERLEGLVMGVNYGFDKVRFLSPVKVGSRVRASSVLAAVEAKDANTLQVTRTITVDIEGEAKPALVADWIGRLIYG
jgi:acyl dehydratase